MSEILYKKEFILRTIKLLESNYSFFKEKDLEVTFLMNCLLGLIIAIFENDIYTKKVFNEYIDEDFLKILPDEISFIKSNSKEISLLECTQDNIELEIGRKKDLRIHNKGWFIKKLRNGIAHQHIKEINSNGKWVGVTIWNMQNSIKNFEISFMVEELRQFAIDLASQYLKHTST